MMTEMGPRFMYETFGGSIRRERGTRGAWVWDAAGLKAADALRAMLPWLREKRSQAEVAFQFVEHMMTARSGRSVSIEDVAFRQHCAQEIKRLKRAA